MGDRDAAASGGLTNGGQEADAGTTPPPARGPPAAMHARDGAPGVSGGIFGGREPPSSGT
eukprot:m.359641 g.359641  ORF g.359641 m.359641 type:complete len:60 (+) comp28044_c0_seq15:228-407(+)